ncbi:hypothetical protein J6590_055235 [Homalodisca vitripennis]|nr:hypothetical protein J6590_055235 [Homalodisca vitripennis]
MNEGLAQYRWEGKRTRAAGLVGGERQSVRPGVQITAKWRRDRDRHLRKLFVGLSWTTLRLAEHCSVTHVLCENR